MRAKANTRAVKFVQTYLKAEDKTAPGNHKRGKENWLWYLAIPPYKRPRERDHHKQKQSKNSERETNGGGGQDSGIAPVRRPKASREGEYVQSLVKGSRNQNQNVATFVHGRSAAERVSRKKTTSILLKIKGSRGPNGGRRRGKGLS